MRRYVIILAALTVSTLCVQTSAYCQKGKIPPKNAAAPKPVVQDTINNVPFEKKDERIEQKKPLEQIIRSSADLEVDGLIVDETITKIGRDFYEIFHNKWEAPALSKNFTILIKEFPTRGNVALVQILVNEVMIFDQLLQPRYDIIEELAGYGVAVTFEYLENDRLRQQLDADGKRAIEKF